MDGIGDVAGACISISELLPHAVLGSGSGSHDMRSSSQIKVEGGGLMSKATTSATKKPSRKRASGDKSASKKRARSESDVQDMGENLHPRPKMSYAQLAALALRATENNEATVGEIYKWIQENYPYYKHGAPWWKNCIRHNLSMKSCFIRTETEQRAFWSLDYEQADQIFNAEKRSAATWQQVTGSGGVPMAGALPKSTAAPKPRLPKSHGASVASLSAAASRRAAKLAAGAAKEMKAPKKVRESKPRKGFKNMGTQTLQSSKSTQTDITLATMASLGLPDIAHGSALGTAFTGASSSSTINNASFMSANSLPRPVVLRTQRGAFSTSFDMLHRPDHGLSLQGDTYPGDLEIGLDDVDSVNRLLDDVPYNGGDDDDEDDGDNGAGFNIDPLAQSWGGFPTNWKDQKGSFESLF